jgi:trans-aconitate methyltransferase
MDAHPEDHWTKVHRDKASDSVSWYQPTPEPSLNALDRLGVTSASSLIDVGGGASNLVDALIARGWTHLTVLDIAVPALEASQLRLGPDAAKVEWKVADITRWVPSAQYDVWHDRAVFHFLTEPAQRDAYRRALLAGVPVGGLVVIAVFALDGLERCSGLLVQRYDAQTLARELGAAFTPIECWNEDHLTPWGAAQRFTWCTFRRTD